MISRTDPFKYLYSKIGQKLDLVATLKKIIKRTHITSKKVQILVWNKAKHEANNPAKEKKKYMKQIVNTISLYSSTRVNVCFSVLFILLYIQKKEQIHYSHIHNLLFIV